MLKKVFLSIDSEIQLFSTSKHLEAEGQAIKIDTLPLQKNALIVLGNACQSLDACEGLRSQSVHSQTDPGYLIQYVIESSGSGAVYTSRLRWHHSLLQLKNRLQDGALS